MSSSLESVYTVSVRLPQSPGGLTPPWSGRLPASFACLQPPLMANVGYHIH